MDEDYFVTVLLYVERNPVRAGIAGKPWQWKWSSAGGHVWKGKGIINLKEDNTLI